MNGRYILVKQKAVPCEDLFEWGEWMQNRKKHVGDTTKRGVRVSTVFLGLDHQYGDGEPLLFETMIFGKSGDLTQRYSTMNQAREGHRQAVKLARRITKCQNKKLSKQNHLSRTIETPVITVIKGQPSSSPDHNLTILTCVAPAISAPLKL